jgi:hypothetical protein
METRLRYEKCARLQHTFARKHTLFFLHAFLLGPTLCCIVQNIVYRLMKRHCADWGKFLSNRMGDVFDGTDLNEGLAWGAMDPTSIAFDLRRAISGTLIAA